MQQILVSREIETPLGPMVAMAGESGLVLLEFADRPALPRERDELEQRYCYRISPGDNAVLRQVESELRAYFAGELTGFRTLLSLPATQFQQRVWTALQGVPFGHTRTYGQLAQQLGNPHASRAVGAANGQNRVSIIVPCHRVLGADGSLTGYGGGQRRKRYLLDLEHRVRAATAGTPVFHPVTAQASMF